MARLPYTTDWQFERYDEERECGETVEIVVHYDIDPYVPASWDAPAEGGGVTDLIAYGKDGREFGLTGQEAQDITDWIERHHDHNPGPDPDAAYEAMRDERMGW